MFNVHILARSVSAAFAGLALSATALAVPVQIQLTGEVEGTAAGNSSLINFAQPQKDFLNVLNKGATGSTPYDLLFSFDTDDGLNADVSFSGTVGDGDGMLDLSGYEASVTVYGGDRLSLQLYWDIDEAFGYPGSWFNQILFELHGTGLIDALENSGTTPVAGDAISAVNYEFRAHRNRNGLYYRYHQGAGGDATVVSDDSSGGTGGQGVPEPTTLLLLGVPALLALRRRGS